VWADILVEEVQEEVFKSFVAQSQVPENLKQSDHPSSLIKEDLTQSIVHDDVDAKLREMEMQIA